MKFLDYGDQGLLVDFGDTVSQELNQEILDYCNLLREKNFPEIAYVIPTYNKLTVYFKSPLSDQNPVRNFLSSKNISLVSGKSKTIEIPACFEPEFGLDIQRIADYCNVTSHKLIDQFCSKPYYVYGYGFLPGMPKYGDTDFIAPKRLDKPRENVPKGSIGSVEKYCSVYTEQISGGWNIIGRTPVKFFNKDSESPCLVNPGDLIQYFPVTSKEYKNYANN